MRKGRKEKKIKTFIILNIPSELCAFFANTAVSFLLQCNTATQFLKL